MRVAVSSYSLFFNGVTTRAYRSLVPGIIDLKKKK